MCAKPLPKIDRSKLTPEQIRLIEESAGKPVTKLTDAELQRVVTTLREELLW